MLQKTYAVLVSWPIVRSPIDIVADFGRDIILWMKVVVGMKCYALTKGTIIQPTVVIAAVVCLCVNIATRTFIISWGVFFLPPFFFFCPPPHIEVVGMRYACSSRRILETYMYLHINMPIKATMNNGDCMVPFVGSVRFLKGGGGTPVTIWMAQQ